MLQERTGKPFWGVVPMLENLRLPEEDSVSFKEGLTPGLRMGQNSGGPGLLDIVVPDLPHLSNATDLDALRDEPGVQLRIVRHADQWGAPHVVILPGSRNTVGDLRFFAAHRAGRAGAEICPSVPGARHWRTGGHLRGIADAWNRNSRPRC